MIRTTSHKVFISYAKEDHGIADRLYADLVRAAIRPWMDTRDLIGGQEWRLAIRQAIRDCSYFLVLLSRTSVGKKGYVQKEIREALEVLDEVPEGRSYLIPIRIDECRTTNERVGQLHWIDLFPSYDSGFQKLVQALTYQTEPSSANAVYASPPHDKSLAPATLAHVLADCDRAEITQFRHKLAILGGHSTVASHVVSNLDLETRLPVPAWTELIHAVLKAKPTPDDISRALLCFFRANRCVGTPITLPPSTVFLTILYFSKFAHRLVRQGHFSSYEESLAAVGQFARGDDESLATFARVPMSEDVQWCTFDPSGISPFDDEPQNSEYYLSCLGAPLPSVESQVLAIKYNLPEGVCPRFPTVCDAGMFMGFRPAPPAAPYGLTVPWTSNPDVHPRPEAIHLPILFSPSYSVRLLT